MIRVVVVDDQPLVRAGIAMLVNAEEDIAVTLLARGMSNADAAVQLFISEATVKTHLARVMMKLGVREKAQAAAAAYQTGLVHPPAPKRY